MKRIISLLVVFVGMVITLSFVLQEDPWKVPKKYESMKNPVTADDASIQSGKKLYVSYCLSCHGIHGKGDGKRADNLNTPPTDFATDSFQQQTDGALLYKIYFGHKGMPGFKKRIPGEEGVNEASFGKTRIPGDLINFVRSFGK